MNLQDKLLEAVEAHKAGDLSHAEAGYLNILSSFPEVYDALHMLGLIYRKRGKLYDASAFLRSAIRINPKDPVALGNYAGILNELGNYNDAATCARLALELDPNDVAANTNLGNAKFFEKKYSDAIQYYHKALECGPATLVVATNLASALVSVGDYDEAIKTFRSGLAIAPNDPELNFGYACLLLQMGNYREGFRRYEARVDLAVFGKTQPHVNFPTWRRDSTLLGRTILLRAEQGLGDTIQFARYIPAIAEMAQTVFVEVPVPLLRLLKNSFGSIATFLGKGDALPVVDYQCSLASLPYLLESTLETIPFATQAYLKPSANRLIDREPEVKGEKKKHVGFVWNANRVPIPWVKFNSEQRSIPLEDFEVCLRVPGIVPIALQKEMSPQDELLLKTIPNLKNLGPQFDDFADTAAVIAQLDLVVTVDTSVAHVAGALGIPVWILVPNPSDWRWLLNRSDSVWYGSARLFRQSQPGDWTLAIENVAEAIRLLNIQE